MSKKPGGIQVLPTPAITYRNFTYWIDGELEPTPRYHYRIGRKTHSIRSDQTFPSVTEANQAARKAIDLIVSVMTKHTARDRTYTRHAWTRDRSFTPPIARSSARSFLHSPDRHPIVSPIVPSLPRSSPDRQPDRSFTPPIVTRSSARSFLHSPGLDMDKTVGWWGYLTEDNKFREIWTDGDVPLRHPFPFIPTHNAPPCYLLDESRCTPEQLDTLAQWIYQQWEPECISQAQALAYLRHPGLPLNTDHFTGIGTADSKMLNAFLDD